MAGHLGFRSISDRLAEIPAQGDPFETPAMVDFEMFRPVLERALGRLPCRKAAGRRSMRC